jgi:hypothetical protein
MLSAAKHLAFASETLRFAQGDIQEGRYGKPGVAGPVIWTTMTPATRVRLAGRCAWNCHPISNVIMC